MECECRGNTSITRGKMQIGDSEQRGFDPMKGKSILYFTMALGLCCLFTMSRFIWNDQNELSPVKDLLSFNASRPFQYRILIPMTVSWAYNHEFVKRHFSSPNLLFLIVEFLSIILLFASFRRFLTCFLESQFLIDFGPVVFFYSLASIYILPRFNPFWYPWDMPSLVFFVYGMIFLREKKWVGFYPLFFLATLNRETTCFLTVIFIFVSFGKISHKELITHSAVQIGIWVGIKFFLSMVFQGNPGPGIYEDHLWENLQAFLEMESHVGFISCMGFLWFPVILFFRDLEDDFLKKSLWMAVLFFMGMMLVGNITELRIFGELVPIVVTSFLVILQKKFFTSQ